MRIQNNYFIWDRGEDVALSPHFSTEEFDCSCGKCTEQTISKDLIMKLDRVRAQLNSALLINSGYRCAAKQQELRDAGYETSIGKSQHELGNAADIGMPLAKDKADKLKIICLGNFKAVGIANSFVHVDLRVDKERRWTYAHA